MTVPLFLPIVEIGLVGGIVGLVAFAMWMLYRTGRKVGAAGKEEEIKQWLEGEQAKERQREGESDWDRDGGLGGRMFDP